MKTQINVVVRVRPLLEHEQDDTTNFISLDEKNAVIK